MLITLLSRYVTFLKSFRVQYLQGYDPALPGLHGDKMFRELADKPLTAFLQINFIDYIPDHGFPIGELAFGERVER